MRALRRNASVPIPAAASPMTRSATVTPVTLARRLMPRHQRVTASVLLARAAAPFRRCLCQAVLPAFSM